MLFQGACIQFPASTCRLLTVYNSSSREFDPFFYGCQDTAYLWFTYIHIGQTVTHRKFTNKQACLMMYSVCSSKNVSTNISTKKCFRHSSLSHTLLDKVCVSYTFQTHTCHATGDGDTILWCFSKEWWKKYFYT